MLHGHTQLFQSQRGAMLPAALDTNNELAPAYAFSPRHQLAQLAATGCLRQTFYAQAQDQLDRVMALAAEVDPAFVARTAVYARESGHMKDMPALLAAILAVRDLELLAQVFPRVIDSGKMLRNFVQILRSGAVGASRWARGPAGAALAAGGHRAAAERGRGQCAFAGGRGQDGASQACRGLARGLVRLADRQAP